MPEAALVRLGDPGRPEIEAFIRRVYALRHNAQVDTFPSNLIAVRDVHGDVICAAGLRTAEDGFFSESYLDAPVERILSRLVDKDVDRNEILEISTLVSLAPAKLPRFLARLIAFGEEHRFSWSFFTATRRLRRVVEKVGLAPIYLADADRTRIENSERWGSYYALEPRVYAVTRLPVRLIDFASDGRGHHALPV